MPPFKKVNHRLILWLILTALLLLSVALSIFSMANTPEGSSVAWWAGWAQNVSTDILGAILTYLLFELIIARRQRQEESERETSRRKSWLIERLGSANNQEALKALEELSEQRWLHDGSLKGAFLREANLEGADLRQADLRGADLRGAILRKANMMRANLAGAYLVGTDFEGAIDLDRAEFDENTRLPDRHYWKNGIDMRAYTRPKQEVTPPPAKPDP